MLKFNNFIKRKSYRFVWKNSDLEHHSMNEDINTNIANRLKQTKAWENHSKTLDNEHIYHVFGYKNNSDINYKLHHKERLNPSDIEHIKILDHVTSHKTEHPVEVYRGFEPEDYESHKIYEPGHEFTHRGYTSTTFNKKIAAKFSPADSTTGKPTLFKINLPLGSNAHYVDTHKTSEVSYKGVSMINPHPHEQEVLLKRKQRFKVTGHSEDNNYKYIHINAIN